MSRRNPIDRDERRRRHARYRQAELESGEPFFPHAVWRDAVFATVLVALVVLVTVVWYSSAQCGHLFDVTCSPRSPEAQQAAHPVLGPTFEQKADPSTTTYNPRPDWYFFALFESFRILGKPPLALIPTLLFPLVLLLAMLALPVIDRRTERRLLRRPVALGIWLIVIVTAGVLTWRGATVDGAQPAQGDPPGITAAAADLPGWKIVQQQHCLSCHIIGTQGRQELEAPILTDESARARGVYWQLRHLQNPRSRTPDSKMPAYGGAPLSPLEARQVAEFLESLGDTHAARWYAAHGSSAS